MWPTLEVGSRYRVLARGRSKTFPAMLVGVGRDGELSLALVPSTPKRRWRPLVLLREQIKGVFGPASV